MQALLGAIHAAAGNRRGARAARRFRLVPREKVTPRLSAALSRFPISNEGLITPEMIAARQRELGLV